MQKVTFFYQYVFALLLYCCFFCAVLCNFLVFETLILKLSITLLKCARFGFKLYFRNSIPYF